MSPHQANDFLNVTLNCCPSVTKIAVKQMSARFYKKSVIYLNFKDHHSPRDRRTLPGLSQCAQTHLKNLMDLKKTIKVQSTGQAFPVAA